MDLLVRVKGVRHITGAAAGLSSGYSVKNITFRQGVQKTWLFMNIKYFKSNKVFVKVLHMVSL